MTPYRSAALKTPPDTHVFCRACGLHSPVAFAETSTFTCPCGIEQPVLAGDDPIAGGLELVSSRLGSYPQLGELARSLGELHDASLLVLRCDGLPIEVSVSTNSGTVMGLDVSAKTPGLPPMRFVSEEARHVESKSKGITREVQTGDAEFDRAVYVESSVSDDDVLRVLASSAVRNAIRELVRNGSPVNVEFGAVTVTVPPDLPWRSNENLRRTIWLVRVVAGAPRRFEVKTPPLPRIVKLTRFVGVLSLPVLTLAMVFAFLRYPPTSGMPVLAGIVVGIVLGIATWPLLGLALRGRSTSHTEIRLARILACVSGPLFGVVAVVTANGLFDRSPERMIVMPVTSWQRNDDDKDLVSLTVARGPDGHEHSYSFAMKPDPDPKKCTIQAYWHAGAFGFPWESSDAVLLRSP